MRNPPTNLAVVVLLATLLPLLAALQYSWLGQLSEAEQQRMRYIVRAATRSFYLEFDHALAHIYQALLIGSNEGQTTEEQLAIQYSEWAGEFEFPELIDSIFWITNHETAGLTIQRFDTVAGRLEETKWPASLDNLKKGFAHSLRASDSKVISPLQPEIPGLVIRQLFFRPPSEGDSEVIGWAVVLLDRQVLVDKYIPSLSEKYFSGEDVLQFEFAIVSRDDPDDIIYNSNPDLLAIQFSNPDASRGIFGLRSWDFWEGRGRSHRAWNRIRGHSDARWDLLVTHQAGSLQAAVAAVRSRNLFISFSVLVFLGLSVLMIVVSTRRAQRLAQQQMEFVAGVSHELRTPLAVIRTAAENLADKVIHDPNQTQEYGQIIDREGRRLSEMVERVLLFSRIQSGHASYKMRPVEVGDVIDGALDASQALIAEKAVQIEKEIPAVLPAVMADERALKSAIQNLISNAVKYSSREGPVTVAAREQANGQGSEIEIAIQDRGNGIPSSEVPRIFEPFYRGREVREAQVEGSGLGLSLVKEIVEAHGGRVTVTSSPGRGSTFILHLPAADRSATEIAEDRA